MPVRQLLTNGSGPYAGTRKVWVNGVLTNDDSFSAPQSYLRYWSSRAWDNTPNFWALRRARAKLPDNNLGCEFEVNSSDDAVFLGQFYTPAGTTTRIQASRPAGGLTRIPSHGVSLTNFDLYSRLVDKARRSDFSLPIALVEGRRTVQMVAETARLLAGVMSDLRRGNFVGATRRLGIEPSRSQVGRFNRRFGRDPSMTAANYWLQYQYGWKPLMNDAKNAAEAVAELVNRSDSSTSSVSASSRLVQVLTYPNYVLENSPRFEGNVRLVVRISRRATWRFRPLAADLPGLLGLVNPFEVAWEIIPFSFVADWFLPIGRYLSSLDAPLRFSHIGGTTGYRMQEESVTVPTFGSMYGFNVPSMGGGYSRTRTTVSRNKLTSAPTPTLSSMSFEPKLGATRLTSAVALLRQQASRLGR